MNRERINLTLMIALLVIFVIGNVYFHRHEPQDDLASSYLGCKMLQTENASHLYDFDPADYHLIGGKIWPEMAGESGITNFLHPYVQIPLWAYALTPLCQHLSFTSFRLIFLAVIFISLAATIGMTAILWAPRFIDDPILFSILLLLFSLTTPVSYVAYLGQAHPLFLFLTFLAVVYSEKNRWLPAGLTLAIAATIKITPIIFIFYWLIRGQWRSVISFMGWLAVITSLSLLLLGIGMNVLYLHNLERISNILLLSFNNQSFAAWLGGYSLSPKETLFFKIDQLPSYIKFLSYGFMVLPLWLIQWAKRINPACLPLIHPLSVSLLLAASVIFANIAWNHYFIFLIIPAMIVFSNSSPEEDAVLIWLAAMWFLNLYPVSIDFIKPEIKDTTIIRCHFYAGLACMGVLIQKIVTIARKGVFSPPIPVDSLKTS